MNAKIYFNQRDNSVLYEELPGIVLGEKIVLYSPYSKKIAIIKNTKIIDTYAKQLRVEGFFDKPSDPVMDSTDANITLILTTKCNMNCDYCYVLNYNDSVIMNKDLALDSIKYTMRKNVKRITITFFGGEPSLNMMTLKQTVDYIKYSGISFRFILISNGTFSNKDLDFMIENGFIFCISDDGYPTTSILYKNIDASNKMIRKVRNKIKKIADSGSLLQVRATVTNENLSYIPDAIKIWGSLGVKFLHIEPYGPQNNKDPHLRPSINEYIGAYNKILDEAEKQNLFIISSPFQNLLSPSTYFCTSLVGENLIFTPDGFITGCYRVQTQSNEYSSIFFTSKYDKSSGSFLPIDKKDIRLKKIASSINRKCYRCFAKYICASGCPFRNLVETGSFQKIADWSCLVKKALIKEAIIRIYESSLKGKIPVVFGQALFEEEANKKYLRGSNKK